MWLRRSRLTSFQAALLKAFVPLVLLSAGAVYVLDSLRESRTKAELSQRLVQRGAEHIAERFSQILSEAELAARVLSVAGPTGDLPELVQRTTATGKGRTPDAAALAAVSHLNNRLIAYVQNRSNLSSAQLASEGGLGFLLLQLGPNRFRNRIVNREAWGSTSLWLELDEIGRPVSHAWEDDDYEPRRRPWYSMLAHAPEQSVRWTEPYVLYATQDLGMTAAARFRRHGQLWVCATDVLLLDITRFTQDPKLAFTDNSLSGVFTADWRVVGLPRLARFGTAEARRAALLSPVHQLGAHAIVTSLQKVEPLELGQVKAVPFESAGQSWWAGVAKFPVNGTAGFLIVVAAPDSDLLLGVTESRKGLALATLATLLLALWASVWLARSFSSPLASLREDSRRLESLDFRETQPPVTPIREIRELADAQRRSLSVLESFSRYVPIGVVQELVRRGDVARIGGTAREITALFTDIAGFTRICEQLDARLAAEHLATYFELLIQAVESRNGTIDKFIGDGMFAFWGAPSLVEDRERLAVDAVLAAQAALGQASPDWRHRGLPLLPTRFGLAAGRVIVGNMGSPRRLAYTAVGDPVNLASRLEGLNKLFGTEVLADAAVREGAGARFAWRRVDRVRVAGRAQPVVAHELLGRVGEVPPAVLSFARDYEAAWDVYARGEFEFGADSFAELAVRRPEDAATALMLEQCQRLRERPREGGWEPVTQVPTK